MFSIFFNWHSVKTIAKYALLIPLLIIKTLGWKGLTILALAILIPAFIRYKRIY